MSTHSILVKAAWVGTLNCWAAGVRDQLLLMSYCGVLLTGCDLGQGHVWGVSRPWEPSQQFPLARVVLCLLAKLKAVNDALDDELTLEFMHAKDKIAEERYHLSMTQ